MSADILEYFGPRKRLAQIDAEAVKRYIKFCNTEAKTKKGEPYSATTVQHHFNTLRSVLEYARRFRYIQFDPCQDLSQKEKPKRDKKQIDFLAPEDAKRFIEALETEPLFWRCFVNLLLTTGLRRGEAVGLQWGDIDSNEKTIRVQRNVTIDKNSPDKLHVGDTKTRESRTVPVSPRVLALLMELKDAQQKKFGAVMFPTAYIFCSAADPYRPMYATEPTRWQRKFVERHNLPKVSPHDLRHTAASLALESGANLKQVQTLLGHADPSTTMQFYSGITEEAQRRTVEGIERILEAK
jgi:integrase